MGDGELAIGMSRDQRAYAVKVAAEPAAMRL